MAIKSLKNLESAFAGESMAYQKYLYFAKLAKKWGHPDIAQVFEGTAKHEIGHAEGHLRHLYPEESLDIKKILELAIAGEKYGYQEMYPEFQKVAELEGQRDLVKEFSEQKSESFDHAAYFQKNYEKIARVFKSLAKAEQAHCEGYEKSLKGVL